MKLCICSRPFFAEIALFKCLDLPRSMYEIIRLLL
jgi:hypothetical protein